MFGSLSAAGPGKPGEAAQSQTRGQEYWVYFFTVVAVLGVVEFSECFRYYEVTQTLYVKYTTCKELVTYSRTR